MKKLSLLIILICGIYLWGFAQNDITDVIDKDRQMRIDSLFNDLFFGDDYFFTSDEIDLSYQLFYLRANYSSNTFYAGREIGVDQYNIGGQLYYLNSNGLFAGVSGVWYSQLDPEYRSTVLSLGYSKALKKANYFRYRLSYDYYLYNTAKIDYDPVYSSGLNAGITLKSKSVGARFDASFLLGKEVGTQLSSDLYGKLTLIKLGSYDRINIEPELSFFFGSEAVEYDLSEILIDPFTNEEYSTFYKDEFGLMNIQLEIPLNIIYKNFDVELAWTHNFPQTMDKNLEYKESSFFRFSIGYFLQL